MQRPIALTLCLGAFVRGLLRLPPQASLLKPHRCFGPSSSSEQLPPLDQLAGGWQARYERRREGDRNGLFLRTANVDSVEFSVGVESRWKSNAIGIDNLDFKPQLPLPANAR